MVAWRHRFPQHFRHSRASNSKTNCPIWPEIELFRDLISALVISKCDEDPIKTECANLAKPFSHYKSLGFLDARGHLTPKKVVRSGRNSKSSEILCLSSLPARLTKIGSKLKGLAWIHRFPHNFRHSRASNSEVNDPIRLKVILLRDFMSVLAASKCDEDPIKNERV